MSKIKRARKPTVFVRLCYGVVTDVTFNDPNVDVVFVDEDVVDRGEQNARNERGEPCSIELYKGSKNLNPQKVGYWRRKALRRGTEVSDAH